jgi:hypothetical protein
VRIIPVEYSEVITIAPSTAMMNSPRKRNTPSAFWVASYPALLPGLLGKLEAAAQETRMPRPTETMNSAPSVQ